MAVILLLPFCIAANEIIVIPEHDERTLAEFFVEECLSRGITNTTGVEALQEWAVKELAIINSKRDEHVGSTKNPDIKFDYKIAIPEVLHSITEVIPACTLHETNRKPIDADMELLWEKFQKLGVSREELEEGYYTVKPERKQPMVLYYVDTATNEAVAITLSWRQYGITVGKTNYVFDRRVAMKHRVSDGVYTWALN